MCIIQSMGSMQSKGSNVCLNNISFSLKQKQGPKAVPSEGLFYLVPCMDCVPVDRSIWERYIYQGDTYINVGEIHILGLAPSALSDPIPM